MGVDGVEDEPAEVGPPCLRGRAAPPGTAWTRADALRVDDLVEIGDDAVDRLARVVAIEPAGSSDRRRLRLMFEVDGGALARCTQTPAVRTRYLRRVPDGRAPSEIPVTTVEGLESAWRIFDHAWDADGAVAVYLPALVAGQVLRDRGWERLQGLDEEDRGWRAPSGERYPETSGAVCFALTAEYADASAARA